MHGGDAGERSVEDLCRLLNERIRDRAYHVDPEFLRNEWHSYSYEFVCYVYEFCQRITKDPRFAFNAGKDKLTPQIVALSKPYSIQKIYTMYPHFVQKYAPGCIVYEVGGAGNGSATLRAKFTDHSYRQFGPYRKRCVEMICQSTQGTMSAVPERIHQLPPATIRHAECIADGAEWCVYEAVWSTQPRRRPMWTGWKGLLGLDRGVQRATDPAEPAGVELARSAGATGLSGSSAPLLPKDHTILERPFMEFQPFGVDAAGRQVRDLGGAVVKANVEHLQERVAAQGGEKAGADAITELCRLLNERIRDPAYHVTPEFLKNEWNSYSYEFACYLREFAKQLAGDPLFVLHAGMARHIPPIVQVLCRPFSMQQIYQMVPHLGARFARGITTEVVSVTDSSAVIRMNYTGHVYRQFGVYRRACASHGCQSVKGALIMLPQRVHQLPVAKARDLKCVVNGDEYCEWELSWVRQSGRFFALPAWEIVVGGSVFLYVRHFHPSFSAWEAAGLVAFIVATFRLATHRLRQQSAKREALIQEQVQVVEARHEELREVYLEQEQTQVELRQKVNQLTALHRQIEELNVGLEAKVRERTDELERLNRVLRSANEQLHELDRLKSEFFANVSHEFRTPLTLTLGAFRTLLKAPLPAQSKELIETGLRNTSRLLFLINEFLDLAKFDSGSMQLRKQCIDLAALVRAVAANFESAEGRRIHFQGASAPVPIEADLGQMKKVLYNLLSNAFKFSDPDKGEVWIRLASAEDRVELVVEDNGIGIPDDQLGRIFERFVQVERRATRRHEGTGIGLALVREIVTLHGGTIKVESQLDRGSTFIISLPRGEASEGAILPGEEEDAIVLPISSGEPPDQASQASDALKAAGERPLVLVVDDNADMRGYLARLLSGQYRIALARDGLEGMEQAKTFRPELILSDLMMPRMSGQDLLKAVRKDEALRATPVVFLTARTGAEARVESLEAGADDYIAKPFDENEILARVGNLIRARAQERRIAELQKEKLAQFLPAPLADMILADRADPLLKSHRAEITVAFIDLRGFTTFTETAEPEDTIAVLREYQAEMGRIVAGYQGVIERYSGDAMMIYFNDPVPVPNHAEQAVRMAMAMRQRMDQLRKEWKRHGIELGAGIGIATGYATLGLVGCDRRKDYAAIGVVTNLAARLCGEARHGQILISERVRHFVKDLVHAEPVGALVLKGFHKPVPAYNVAGLVSGRPPVGDGKAKKKKRD
jgi:signal transduction histidine kinase/class 3 adenylate cyclase